jgi:dethiobiotin synthetase
MLTIRRPPVPALFVTATDTGVGKTLVAAGIARVLRGRGKRVAVLKPAASGCARVREGLVSEDAELLAAASDTPHPLDLICPNRFEEPLAPGVAARRAGMAMDWDAVGRSIQIMCKGADLLVVEGAGGIWVPMDDQHTVRDLIVALACPAIVVARPGLGTINHTVLTVESLRSVGVNVAGVVINRYPPDQAGVAEETSPREIERFGKTSILAIVPDEPFVPPVIGSGVMGALGAVDWEERFG